MHTPNQRTLDLLAQLRDHAQTIDVEDGAYLDEMRKLARDYGDWLSGKWTPTADRAREYFSERLFCAIEYAQDGGWHDQAAALIAIRPDITGEDE